MLISKIDGLGQVQGIVFRIIVGLIILFTASFIVFTIQPPNITISTFLIRELFLVFVLPISGFVIGGLIFPYRGSIIRSDKEGS